MKKIALYVLSFHLLALVWMAVFAPPKLMKKKPLTVRTVVQAPPPPPQKAVVQAPPVKSAVQKVSNPTQKKVAPKKTAPKKIAKSPAPAQKKATTSVPQNLVQELQQSLAKIDEKSPSVLPNKALKAPTVIQTLKVDSLQEATGEENRYAGQLVEALQAQLNLPEMGKVKISLSLTSEGQIVQLRILSSENKRNEKFLEEELKQITFPPFTGSLKKEKEHTFVLSFCNL